MNIERYIDLFCSMLKNSQLKCTTVRQDILRSFFQKKHLTIEDILSKVDTSKPTVYATIKLLLSFNIISKERMHGETFYELSRGHNHFHFLCNSCKEFSEFTDETLTDLMFQLSHKSKFQPNKLDMTIYGTCNNCSSDNKYQ